jgi:hypothetical protein
MVSTWHGLPSAQLGEERKASVPWSSHSVRAWGRGRGRE